MTTEDALLRLVAEGIVKTDAAILVVLSCAENKGLSPSKIANSLGISKQLCSMVVHSLLADGFIEHRYPYFDRRKVTVYLTPSGVKRATTVKHFLLVFGNSLLNDRDVVGLLRNGGEVETEVG